MTLKRVEIMEQGIKLTTGDRNASYGDPGPNLQTFSSLVETYLKGLGWSGPALTSVDGSMLMVLLKVSRVAADKNHEDNYVDGSTYFAIAGECAHSDTPPVCEDEKVDGFVYDLNGQRRVLSVEPGAITPFEIDMLKYMRDSDYKYLSAAPPPFKNSTRLGFKQMQQGLNNLINARRLKSNTPKENAALDQTIKELRNKIETQYGGKLT